MAKTRSNFDRAMEFSLAEVERVGNVELLPPPVRTLVLVLSAQGLIDNGGLQYFFESDFPGQPPYSVFADAYRDIGADEGASTLAEAADLFPFPEPHRFQTKRREFLERFQSDLMNLPNGPFEMLTLKLCGNKKVWRLLEKYVGRNMESFGLVRKPAPIRSIAVSGRYADNPPAYAVLEGTIPSLRELADLIQNGGDCRLTVPEEPPDPWAGFLEILEVREEAGLVRFERWDDSLFIVGEQAKREAMANLIRGFGTSKQRYGRISPPPHMHLDLASDFISPDAGELVVEIRYDDE